MTVLATLTCNLMDQPSDHEVDTRSGEAACTVCGDTFTVDPADLLDLLED